MKNLRDSFGTPPNSTQVRRYYILESLLTEARNVYVLPQILNEHIHSVGLEFSVNQRMARRIHTAYVLDSTPDALHGNFMNLPHPFNDMQFEHVHKRQQRRFCRHDDPIVRNPRTHGARWNSQPMSYLGCSVRTNFNVLKSLRHLHQPLDHAGIPNGRINNYTVTLNAALMNRVLSTSFKRHCMV